MSLRFGSVRVANIGLTAGGAVGVYSNGTVKMTNCICNTQLTSNAVTCNALVFKSANCTFVAANTVVCNALSCNVALTCNSMTCNTLVCNGPTVCNSTLTCNGGIMAPTVYATTYVASPLLYGTTVTCTQNLTCVNGTASNTLTCNNLLASNLVVSNGISQPNAASFTGEYMELDDTPIAAHGCYSNNVMTNNMKVYAASAVSTGTTGKATFYPTTTGANTGPAIFGTISSIQATPYYPTAGTFSAVICCVTSVSTDNKNVTVYGTTNSQAVPANTRFYLLVHGF